MSIIGNPLILPSGGGGLNGNWMGDNPTLMTGTGWSYSTTIYLKDTSYPTWTPSTTSSTILSAGTTNVITVNNNFSEGYDYILFGKMDVNVAYLSGATLIKTPKRYIRVAAIELIGYPSSYESLVNYARVNGDSYTTDKYMLFYYDANGGLTCSQISYGPAYSGSVALLSVNSSSSIATFGIKLPALNARCSTSYFTTDRAAEVDVNNTTIKFDYSVYRVDGGTSITGELFREISNILNNPL